MALTRRKKRRIRRIILAVLGIIICIAAVISLPTVMKVLKLRNEAVAIAAKSKADDFKSTQTTVAYDSKGSVLLTMRASKDMYYVTYSEIPQVIKDAFVVTEDKKFYSHKGIDYFSILRAIIANQKSDEIEQGASTITQQLARNVYLKQEVTWDRKITEMFLARELEKKYSKQQILEFYINNIYFANGYYGIEAAARGYFSKGVSELTTSEMVFLAAIPNSPGRYDPVKNINSTLERRNLVLLQMYEDGKLNTVSYHTALGEEIVLNEQQNHHNNYVDTYVKRCATESLMKAYGFSFQNNFENESAYNAYCDKYDQFYSTCQQKLFGGGYTIYTSIDTDKQKALQEAVDNALADETEVNDEGVYALQGAATCIDNSTGNVVAIVGGRTQDYDGYTLNRAYQSYRQPGSTIKPLNVYTPYLQLGATPDSIVTDEAIEGGPANADRNYSGDMTLREAVRVSKNTVAWSIYEKITPKAGTAFLIKSGFRKVFVDKDRVAGALGGFTYGVTTEEMAGGYAAIENDGIYRTPTCITQITTIDGREIVNTSDRGTKVYEKDACRMMTDMLQTVVSEGTGAAAAIDNAIVAGKTGTTNDNKDSWFVGYSRYYTTSVWVGYDMPKTITRSINDNKTIWHDYMEKIHAGMPQLPFAQYTVKQAESATQQASSKAATIHSEPETVTNVRIPSLPSYTAPADIAVTGPAVPVQGSVSGLEHNAATLPRGDNDADISGLGDRDASGDSSRPNTQ